MTNLGIHSAGGLQGLSGAKPLRQPLVAQVCVDRARPVVICSPIPSELKRHILELFLKQFKDLRAGTAQPEDLAFHARSAFDGLRREPWEVEGEQGTETQSDADVLKRALGCLVLNSVSNRRPAGGKLCLERRELEPGCPWHGTKKRQRAENTRPCPWVQRVDPREHLAGGRFVEVEG